MQIEIKELQKIKLEKDDVLIVKVKRNISIEQKKKLRDLLQDTFKDNIGVLLTEDIDLKVYTKKEQN